MATHKSAEKRDRQSKKHRERNIAVKSALKTKVNAVITAVEGKKKKDSASALKAVIPALNVADTLKRVSEESVEAQQEDSIADSILGEDAEMSKAKGRFVQATVDRRNLVAVQTPQVFKADVLRRAYAQTDLSGVTDDASLVERMGTKVLVVDGELRNLKVTVPEDLRTIRLLLGIAAPEGRAVHKRF